MCSPLAQWFLVSCPFFQSSNKKKKSFRRVWFHNNFVQESMRSEPHPSCPISIIFVDITPRLNEHAWHQKHSYLFLSKRVPEQWGVSFWRLIFSKDIDKKIGISFSTSITSFHGHFIIWHWKVCFSIFTTFTENN